MNILTKCMNYPCPFDPTELSSKPPKYHLSSLATSSDEPPPYSEKPEPAEKSHKRKISQVSLSYESTYYKRPCRISKIQYACPCCKIRYFGEVLRQWVLKQRKPYTAVTVQVDRLTSEQYEENDMGGIVDLIEVIRLQASGPTEAARALRKKLKYGNVHRQLRALTILDGLLENGGDRFQRSFIDEPLLERLRIMGKDDMVDTEVRAKCNILFRQWAQAYKSTQGLQGISTLYKELPRTKRPLPQQSKVIRDTEVDADNPSSPTSPASPAFARAPMSASLQSPSQASSSSRPAALSTNSTSNSSSFFKRDKTTKTKTKSVDLAKEKPQLLETIASASVASTNLLNALKLVNRETSRINEDPEVMNRFEQCKSLRRQILRYIQAIESDEWIGSLLSANDELVKALMAFEIMDKSISDDSDSEAELGMGAGPLNRPTRKDAEAALAGLQLKEAPPAKPPRPVSMQMPPAPGFKHNVQDDDEEPLDEAADDDDPFGDQNAVKTPHVEKGGMTW
ncbi:MAG: putative actin patch assembly and actin polymerization protein [Bogoriella megaspora]|nr:MAG: putative actin patch assembly and actin polymerization protein [Bogoriella megaspora]